MAAQYLKKLMEGAGIPSKDRLAKKVLESWQEEDSSPGDFPGYRSVSIKIGNLERGDTTWWENRRPAADALAALLNTDWERLLADLGIRRRAQAHFSNDLPVLPPFDVEDEEPCNLMLLTIQGGGPFGETSTWSVYDEEPLSHDPLPLFPLRVLKRPTWITGEPGIGRSFLTEWLSAHLGFRVLEATSLSDIERDLRDSDVPTIVDLSGFNPISDGATAKRLSSKNQLVVLATFPFSDEGESSGDDNEERWQQAHLALRIDWRRRLLGWIENRLEGGALFDVKGLLEWLERVDPDSETFRTPADLLQLCARVFDRGLSDLKRKTTNRFEEEWLGSFLDREAKGNESPDVWLRTSGADAFVGLVCSRLGTLQIPWEGGLTRDQWAKLLPNKVVPSYSERDLEEALSEMVAADSADERRRLQDDVIEAAGTPGRASAIEHLRSIGLLTAVGPSSLDLKPNWVVRLIAKKYIRKVCGSDQPQTWGRWAVDIGRRRLVENVLQDMKHAEVEELVRKVVDSFDPADLGTAGAVEMMFAEVGRRLQDSWKPTSMDELHRLWNCQRSLLVDPLGEDLLVPITTSGWDTAYSEVAPWIATCWAWSIYASAPEDALDPRLRMFFPGWCSLEIDELAPLAHWSLGAPAWPSPSQYHGSRARTRAHRSVFQRLQRLAPHIIERVAGNSLPLDLPPVLIPTAILSAPARGWSIPTNFGHSLFGTVWMAQRLGELLEHQPPSVRQEVATALWSVLLAAKNGNVFDVLEILHPDPTSQKARPERYRELARLIADELSLDVFRASLDELDPQALLLNLAVIPDRLMPEVVQWALRQPDSQGAIQIVNNTANLNAIRDPDLVVLLARETPNFGWMAIRHLWKANPKRAMSETQTAYLKDPEGAVHWFSESSPEHFEPLLDLLESSEDTRLPSWCLRWLWRRIRTSGSLADRVFRLIAAARGTEQPGIQ